MGTFPNSETPQTRGRRHWTFPKLLMSCVVDIELTGLLMHLNMQVNLSGTGWSEFQFKMDDFG